MKTGTQCDTNVPRLFVAGDASRDAQFVVVAAAEGVKAAVAINKALQSEELRRDAQGGQKPAADSRQTSTNGAPRAADADDAPSLPDRACRSVALTMVAVIAVVSSCSTRRR